MTDYQPFIYNDIDGNSLTFHGGAEDDDGQPTVAVEADQIGRGTAWVHVRHTDAARVADELRAAAGLSSAPADRAAIVEGVSAALEHGSVRCPLCPDRLVLHTPNGARAHFEHVHPEQQITGQWPTPAARATVLREAAQHLYSALFPAVYADMGQKAAEGVNRAVSELRRMADEVPQPETQDEEIALLRLTVDAVEEGRRELRAELARIRAQLWTLAAMLDGLHTLIATSSRDWGVYRVDAWLWAVLCGWDCEEGHEHDDDCDGDMAEIAAMHGWDDKAVAKARRYRAAVRILTGPAPAVGAQQPKEAHAPETVAYQSNGGRLLRCLAHAPEWAAILCGDFHPVTSEDLPDGGLCTAPVSLDERCGVDVLIPQQPKETRP